MDLSVPGNEVRDGSNRQDAKDVSAGGYAEGAVRSVAVVKVQSDGDQTGENGGGRSGEVDAVFEAWEFESRSVDPSRERKHEVLMPGDFPIDGGGFVEGDRLNGQHSRFQKT
jgi:hypothetical protein